VLAIKPLLNADIYVGFFGPYGPEHPAKYEVRAFFPEDGKLVEDPATGSLNASGAQWLIGSGRFIPPYTASQGLAINRAAEISVTADEDGAIWIGGKTETKVTGSVNL
jgi:predicted PhzF superfamily epimerase YddE/YHI9